MSNPFDNRTLSLSGPGRDYAPVTPSDSASLPEVAIALYAERGGAIRFLSEKDEIRTVTVSDFGWILCGVKAVRAAGTTASGIHAVVLG